MRRIEYEKEITMGVQGKWSRAGIRRKLGAKASALHTLEKLPDNATYDDIAYELYVLLKIERGQEDIKRKRTIAHKDARNRLGRFLE